MYSNPVNAYRSSSADEHFRVKTYFAFLDTALQQLNQRFDEQSNALNTCLSVESMFLQGVKNPDVVKLYPELDVHQLSLQLPLFKSQFFNKMIKTRGKGFSSLVQK
jgi:hypothetical protein